MNSFLPLQRGGDAGTRSIFGKRGCVPALINSGRAALSVQLPPEPRCTITQGGHLRSVWVWSCARVMNSCFFSFLLPISTFIPQLICQGPRCNFSPCCVIAFVYFCVSVSCCRRKAAPARSHKHKRLHPPCPAGTGEWFKGACEHR